MSKAHKLYILVGITLPLAVSTIVSAWAEGYLKNAGTFGVVSVSWSVLALYSAWKLSKHQDTDETRHAAEVTPWHRRLMLLEKTSCLFILLIATATLFIVIIRGPHPYNTLEAFWWIIMSAGHLFFVGYLSDE